MGPDHHCLRGAHLAHVAAFPLPTLPRKRGRERVGASVMRPYLVIALVVAATWDAWRWYVLRVWDSPEEAASLVLTIVFLGVLGVARRRNEAVALPLLPITLLLAAFAVSYAFLPPIARAAIAIAATLYCCHVAAFKERPAVAFWGLSAL